MAHQVKAVIFDLGNVLLYFDYAKAVDQLGPHCAVPGDELLKMINQSRLLHLLEAGVISSKEFYTSVRRRSRYRGSFREFKNKFANIFCEEPAMVALNRRCRQLGLQTAIFSNTNDLAIGFIRRNFPFMREFDHYVFSYEVGAMKPDLPIYLRLEERVGARGPELVYIDDRPENIEAGKERGWQVIHHLNPGQTEDQLWEILDSQH